MPWTYDDYPASMKNLTPQVRHKAIDMANAMLEEGYQEGRAIAIATAQAEKWAQRRDKPITQDESGKTGQALAPPSPEENQPPLHVVLNPSEERWVVRQDKKRVAQAKEKGDVLHKAREQAQVQRNVVYIHDEQGNVTDEEDYS